MGFFKTTTTLIQTTAGIIWDWLRQSKIHDWTLASGRSKTAEKSYFKKEFPFSWIDSPTREDEIVPPFSKRKWFTPEKKSRYAPHGVKASDPLSPEDYHFIESVTGLSHEALEEAWIDEIPNMECYGALNDWPAANLNILKQIFSTLGIDLIPAIVFESSKKQDPVTASLDFFHRFNSPEGTPCTRAYLAFVCLFLMDMDTARGRYEVDVSSIYQALENHQHEKAEALLDGLRGVIRFFDEADLDNEPQLIEYEKFLEQVLNVLQYEWPEQLSAIPDIVETLAHWKAEEKRYHEINEEIETYLELLDSVADSFSKEWQDAYPDIKETIQNVSLQLEGYYEEVDDSTEDLLSLLEEILEELISSAEEYISREDDEDADDGVEDKDEPESMSPLVQACNILGLDPDHLDLASAKKAYRRMAAKHHPDKGGEKEKFQEIKAAYDEVMKNIRRSV